MKHSLYVWGKGWGYTLMVLLTIPTLGYTWLVLVSISVFTEAHWQMHCITALEWWLRFWRGAVLVLGGVPTLGFTWTLLNRWGQPYFLMLHVRYAEQP